MVLGATASAVALLAAGSAWATLAPGPSTAPAPASSQPPPIAAAVTVMLDRPLRRFAPEQALGGALDGHSQGETAQIYTPANIRAMGAAGLGQVSYRLRTELGVEAWHIDPAGSFSDPSTASGYWTTTAHPSPRVRVSWGYSLPRRGDTIDQANDTGYSRLDDGSLATFWKSDPYLDAYFTHEPDRLHPQWVLVDLQRPRALDALRIAWAAPYATRFEVQRFVGPSAIMIAGHPPGHWAPFPRFRFAGRPGTQTLRLAAEPVRARFVRLLLLRGSHTAPPGSRDLRDRLGYAIREVSLGTLDRRGALRDLLAHRADSNQSMILTSSTDPWHRASDRDPGYEQPSFQTVLHSGLTRRQPVLVPVPVLYGTPENAVAELRYLRALDVPIRGVELGEEPDGQLAAPEDYGALYLLFARAIHRAFPRLPLGGPGFQTSIPDWLYWPNAAGDRSWTHRFLAYLRAHHALGLLSFFSFEWYPWDDVCAPPAAQLAHTAGALDRLLAEQRAHGVPADLPIYITEYGYSAFAGQDEVDLPGAVLDADSIGTALQDGVTATYLYGYEPDIIMSESTACNTWGNLTLYKGDSSHRALHPLSTFWETQMLTRDWTQPGNGEHVVYATSTSAAAADAHGDALVRAYAVRRPDGRLAVLLVNLSPSQPYDVAVRLSGGSAGPSLPGAPTEWQLSAADYRWQANGPGGHPSLDLPPLRRTLPDGSRPLRLPPYSVTVVLGAALP